MADNELDRFKRDISLIDVAVNEYGYEIDKKESSKSYFVLRSGGDKVIVTHDKSTGHDLYFNARDDNDSGSIIDFVKARVGDNNAKLVRVRQALRGWLHGAKKPAVKKPAAAPVRPAAVTKDMAQVLVRASRLKPYAGNYLTRDRKLDAQTIDAFKVQQDERGNAVFIHHSADGLTGWEAKNIGYTAFAEGGTKSLYSRQFGTHEEVKRIVITEAAIDALSYAQLHGRNNAVFISTAGSSLSDWQLAQLKAGFQKFPNAQVVVASDNDAQNPKYADKPRAEHPSEKMAAQIATVSANGITRHRPKGKDWNDDLVAASDSGTGDAAGTRYATSPALAHSPLYVPQQQQPSYDPPAQHYSTPKA